MLSEIPKREKDGERCSWRETGRLVKLLNKKNERDRKSATSREEVSAKIPADKHATAATHHKTHTNTKSYSVAFVCYFSFL